MERIELWTSKERKIPYLSILPTILIMLCLALFPLIYSLIISFHKYNLIKPPIRFIGFANYFDLILNDSRYVHAIIFTFAFAIIATTFELILGFFIAYLLADKDISPSYSSIIRTIILIPYVVAPVAISYSFKTLIYDPSFGYLNYFLRILKLPIINFFRGFISAPIGLLIMEIILRTPFIIIILYAGIISINPDIIDAARIDGVSSFQKFKYVIIPSIFPIMAVACIIRFLDVVKLFDEAYVLTGGGPGYQTENISLYIVDNAFAYFHMGYACAAAFLFFVLTIIIISIILKRIRL